MKKTIKLALVVGLALSSTSVFATNGSALIGVGAKARGMGGVGIGMSHGAESALSNPALITDVKDTEISFGGTIFMPNVSYDNGVGAGLKDSDADMNIIPAVAVASRVNENFYWGVGIWGTAGMGTDYRSEASNFNMVTNLQLMQFGLPLAYKTGAISIAITPIIQYGALDINYDTDPNTNGSTGEGIAQDLKFGYNFGVTYEMKNITVGAVYKSKIDMDYKNQLPTAMAGFGVAYTNTELSTPEEFGLGISYTMDKHTFGIDYSRIKWSDAKGYEDFMWEDQDVYALGYEYKTLSWALRAGYNYATSPISEQSYAGTNSAGLSSTLVNTLNLLGFPAITESHYTFGGTYNVNSTTSIDLALTYASEASDTYTVMNQDGTTRSITTKHAQTGITAQVNFVF